MSSQTIRAVIFDIGGVVVRTFDHSGRDYWERRLGLSPGGAEATVLNSEIGHRAQRGEISDAELWRWVSEALGLGSDLAQFRDDFWRGDAVDAELVDLIRRLRPRYRTAVISNATDALRATLARHGLLDLFDIVVGSAYEGVMKPDAAIYERALTRLALAAGETVFIDDAPRNVAAAAAMGMLAIQFTPELDLERELAKYHVRAASPATSKREDAAG